MAKKKLFVTNGDESIYLHSENGTAYELAVDNSGALTVTNEATGAVSGGGGGGLPTGGAPHQQLVTDAEGKALWEDRTHWEQVDSIAEVLPETTVTGEGDELPITEPFSADLVTGNEYTVTYNGAAYTCKAQEFDMEGVACAALGNLAVLTGGTATSEPFVMLVFPPEVAAEFGASAMLVPLDGATLATIKIDQVQVTRKIIDPKFLPEASPAPPLIITFTGETGSIGDNVTTGMYVDASDADIRKAVLSGRMVYLFTGTWYCAMTAANLDDLYYDFIMFSDIATDSGKLSPYRLKLAPDGRMIGFSTRYKLSLYG